MTTSEPLDPLWEPTDLPVTPKTVINLSTTQLAIAALRPDLDTLVRQRAYGLYLMRQLVHDEGAGVKRSEPLFELDHSVVVREQDLQALSPAQLLVVQLTPEATDSLVAAASRAFLRRASDAKSGVLARLPAGVSELKMEGVTMRETRALELVVQEGRLSVLQDDENELFAAGSDVITSFKYLGGRAVDEGGQQKQECSLRIACRAYSRRGRAVDEAVVATIFLGALQTDDPTFALLRKTIKGWSRARGFKISAEDVSSAIPELPSPVTTRRSRSRDFDADRTRAERSRSPMRARRRSRSPDDSWGRRVDRDLVVHRPLPAADVAPSWKIFVSNQLAPVDWTPGYWTRLAAFITAVDPRAQLDLPSFTQAEAVFLSFRPDAMTLPTLPYANITTTCFNPRMRIAVETIFRNQAGRLDVEQTRHLLGRNEFPELKEYAISMDKIVACRDVFKEAFLHLAERARLRASNPNTHDPMDRILPVVLSLASDSNARWTLFTDPAMGGRPCTKPHESLSIQTIGAGPGGRYWDKLVEIVRFENEAMDRYMPEGWARVL